MMQSALKFQRLKDLGNGPLSRCQKLACTEFIGAMTGIADCTPLNQGSGKSSTPPPSKKKLLPTDNIFYIEPCSLWYVKVAWKGHSHVLPQPADYGYEMFENADGIR